jgi:hypothetical protein
MSTNFRRFGENQLFMNLSTILAFHQTVEVLSYVAYLKSMRRALYKETCGDLCCGA